METDTQTSEVILTPNTESIESKPVEEIPMSKDVETTSQPNINSNKDTEIESLRTRITELERSRDTGTNESKEEKKADIEPKPQHFFFRNPFKP